MARIMVAIRHSGQKRPHFMRDGQAKPGTDDEFLEVPI